MEQYFPFQSSPLPYGYTSMMPYCDANTLYYHHDDYYTSQVYDLNNLTVRHRLTHMSLAQLLTEDINLPAGALRRLRSAAGAVYNHQLFFSGIGCKAGQPPFNRLTEELAGTYGSLSQFRQLLIEAAESVIGSGWVWLVAEGGHGVHIAATENNGVVNLDAVTPVLILDMWEHAYLNMDHFNKASYVETWFSLIDWETANERYLAALAGGEEARAPAASPGKIDGRG